jgi:hypothetical protein
VQVTSKRRGYDLSRLTRADAKSGALIVVEIYKNRDGNLPVNQLTPSELLWQTFA